MKDAATMKTVDDPKSRNSDNAIKRSMRLWGLSSAGGKPKAFATASEYRARADIVQKLEIRLALRSRLIFAEKKAFLKGLTTMYGNL